MAVELFAGVSVSDLDRAKAWYQQLLGSEPAFLPNDVEAVWELAGSRYLYVEDRPAHAGHAQVTIFSDDFDDRLARIAERGLEPAEQEAYENGVRKAIFRDPDGNEIGFGGAPVGDA